MRRALLSLALLVAASWSVAPALGASGTVAPEVSLLTESSRAATTAGAGSVVLLGQGGVRVAERATATAPWRLTTLDAATGVSETDIASNARGDVVALWTNLSFTATTRTREVIAARRTAAGTWAPPQVVAEHSDANDSGPSGLPQRSASVRVAPDGTAVVVVGTPDGAISARVLPAGSDAWGPPTPLRAAIAPAYGSEPAVALALDRAGDGLAVWSDGRGNPLGWAQLRRGTWTPAAALPGGTGGRYPAVARSADGRWVVAFTEARGTVVTERADRGSWTRPARVAAGYAPRILTGAGTTMIVTAGSAAEMATRASGRTAWRAVRPPLAPDAAAVARDGSLLVGGRVEAGQAAWTRLPAGGGSWTRPRVLSDSSDVSQTQPWALLPSRSGPDGTLLWAALVVNGRLGMPDGGAILQFGDLAPGAGAPLGSLSRITITGPEAPVTAGASIGLWPQFARFAGAARVRAQINRGRGWTAIGGYQSVSTVRPAEVRVTRPGRVRLRLSYGPGFRRATNALAVTVTRAAARRVAAGWYPRAVATLGRDLWVLSGTRRGGSEIRLLDARTGAVRRGPVPVGDPEHGPWVLQQTGARVLVDTETDGVRVLDASAGGLLGPRATFTDGACLTTCTPTTVRIGGRTELPSRTGPRVWNGVTGPDGPLWGWRAVPRNDESGINDGVLSETAPGGAPVERGSFGPFTAHGGLTGEALAVRGGVWMRSAFGAVTWFGTSGGAGVPVGSFDALAGSGRCVWGLSGGESRNPGLTLLRAGGGPAQPALSLGDFFLDSDAARQGVAVSGRVAWVIAPVERTLVRVPLPAC